MARSHCTPVLADLGYFKEEELKKVCKEVTFLGGIPDSIIPGFETINGSLGHGLGVACGMALALKRKKQTETVFVLLGDGELYEGSVWEAIMFAGEHNWITWSLFWIIIESACLIIVKKYWTWSPIRKNLQHLNGTSVTIDGHDVTQLYNSLKTQKEERNNRPKLLIANTIKGKGILSLETDPLCHIKSLKPAKSMNYLWG